METTIAPLNKHQSPSNNQDSPTKKKWSVKNKFKQINKKIIYKITNEYKSMH
jgi:hypothetical protein